MVGKPALGVGFPERGRDKDGMGTGTFSGLSNTNHVLSQVEQRAVEDVDSAGQNPVPDYKIAALTRVPAGGLDSVAFAEWDC
jgi:hypothetical protein